MCPRERVDTVDLNEAEGVERTREIGPSARTGFRAQQQVAIEEQPAGAAIVEAGTVHPATLSASRGGDRTARHLARVLPTPRKRDRLQHPRQRHLRPLTPVEDDLDDVECRRGGLEALSRFSS